MKCLSIVKPLSNRLQKRQFPQWFETAATLARKFGIEHCIPRVEGRQEHHSNVEATTLKDVLQEGPCDSLTRGTKLPRWTFISALKTTKYCLRCSALFQSCWSLKNTINLKMQFSFMLMIFHRLRSPSSDSSDGVKNACNMINLEYLTTRLKL